MKYGEALNRIVRALRVPQARAYGLTPTAFALTIQPMAAARVSQPANASAVARE
jgi:hypothetical protein